MEHRVFAFLSLTLILLLIVGQDQVWAAPSTEDLAKFGEMERTIKELTSSILAMSGASSGYNTGDALANRNGIWPEDLQA